MEGWISLHRQIISKPIFDNEKLLKVFIWCLLKATHIEHEQLVGRIKVNLLPGQFVTGRNKASVELNMKPTTAWEYLKILEKNESIDIKSNNKFSVVTIVNWELYQSEKKNIDSKTDNKSTTNRQQIDTNKNDNNDNNILPSEKEAKKDSKIKKTFNQDDKEYKLANYLSKQIAKRLDVPLKDEATLQRWAVEFERMVRIDGYDIDDIKDVLVFSQRDPFWQTNIMSAGKFRKQYLVLLGKMRLAGD